jgi:uncharacterized membrane protein YqjE
MTEPPGRSPEARVSGFLDAVGRLVVAGLEMAHTRLELIFLELQEGLEGLVGIVLWLLTALFAAGLGLVFGGLTLIFVFWDSHRVLVAALIMSVFLLLAVAAARVVQAKLRAQRSLFATTLTELAKDRGILKAPP